MAMMLMIMLRGMVNMFRYKRRFLKSYITPSNWVTVVVLGKTFCVTRRNILRIPLRFVARQACASFSRFPQRIGIPYDIN